MSPKDGPSPTAVFTLLLFGKQVAYSLAAVARIGVADHMSTHFASIDELAEKVGAQPAALFRVMRLLASVGVFDEAPGQRFALTSVGQLLKSDAPGSLRYLAMFFGDEWSTRAYQYIVDCIRTGCDGVTRAYGKHAFELLAERPDQAETFHRAMTNFSASAAEALLDAYDFSGIKRLADVGGGHGALLSAVLRRYPKMEGILYDLPEVVRGVDLPRQFDGCDDRIRVEGGSFFEKVPGQCDAFIMKHIIHDWSDEHCRTILSLIRQQLPPGGRVLVCEMVVPEDSGPAPAKMLDIEMLVMTVGGKERTIEEFGHLFSSADLRLGRVVTTKTPICIIEGLVA
jgi:O-methyltransferase domain